MDNITEVGPLNASAMPRPCALLGHIVLYTKKAFENRNLSGYWSGIGISRLCARSPQYDLRYLSQRVEYAL